MQAFRLATVFLILLFATIAYASEERCRCTFDDPNYTAIGTKEACTAITRGKKNCEVRFGATAFNEDLVQKVIPQKDYASFRNNGFDITFIYLDALRRNSLSKLKNEDFLSKAIPYFLRSAYLSTTEPLLPISDLQALDQRIDAYFFKNKNLSKAEKIFNNKLEPSNEQFDETTFEIGKGYIVITSGDLRIVTVIFPEVK